MLALQCNRLRASQSGLVRRQNASIRGRLPGGLGDLGAAHLPGRGHRGGDRPGATPRGRARGAEQDFLTDKVTPVSGAVDKKTQRVAIKLEGNDNVVIETGLYNLTNDEVPVLIHIGKDRQEKRLLVRLQQPQEAAAETQP